MKRGGGIKKEVIIPDVNMRNSVLLWINQYKHHVHKVFQCLLINDLMPATIERFYRDMKKHPEIETLLLASSGPSDFLKKEIDSHLRGAKTAMPLLKMARERFIFPPGIHEAYLRIRAHKFIDLVLYAFELHEDGVRLIDNYKQLIEKKCCRPATEHEIKRIDKARRLIGYLNRYNDEYIRKENKPPILINTFDSEIVLDGKDMYELNEEALYRKFGS